MINCKCDLVNLGEVVSDDAMQWNKRDKNYRNGLMLVNAIKFQLNYVYMFYHKEDKISSNLVTQKLRLTIAI